MLSTGKKLFIFEMSVLALIIIGGVLMIKSTRVPASVQLSIPFTPQAPTDHWDRNEDCEEASLTMANAYLDGQTQDRVPVGDALNAINQLKAWENANIGYNMNTGAEATSLMAQGAFGLNVKQIIDYSAYDLKRALTQNKVVLLMINARLLGNPKYAASGPLYHVIVVRGYDGNNFTVNDPGTDSGNSNVYSFEVLKKAAADWDQEKHKMDPNHKVALIISK